MKKVNAEKALALLADSKTPYTVKNTLSSWLTNYANEVPEYINILNSVMEDIE